MSINEKQHECDFQQEGKEKKSNNFQNHLERTPEKSTVYKWGPGFDSPKTKKKE